MMKTLFKIIGRTGMVFGVLSIGLAIPTMLFDIGEAIKLLVFGLLIGLAGQALLDTVTGEW